MFKAKRKNTGEIFQVLSVYCEETTGSPYFLVWENNDWRWRPASSFVPPNYNLEKEKDNV